MSRWGESSEPVPRRPGTKAPPVEVRTYSGRSQRDAAAAFQDDAAYMAKRGYFPVSQSWADGRSGCLRIILLGFIGALVWKPHGSLTVTYQQKV